MKRSEKNAFPVSNLKIVSKNKTSKVHPKSPEIREPNSEIETKPYQVAGCGPSDSVVDGAAGKERGNGGTALTYRVGTPWRNRQTEWRAQPIFGIV